MLSIEDVSVGFGGVRALSEVSFQAQTGEVIGVIGPNGAGKTTLFNAIMGLVEVQSGHIRLTQRDITRWSSHRIARSGIQRTLQTPQVFQQITVMENLVAAQIAPRGPHLTWAGLGLSGGRRYEKEAVQKAQKMLEGSPLRNEADKPAGDLSFGHQRLLEIYRALILNPQVVLLDEPLSGLTRQEADVVLNLVNNMRQEHRTVLLVEHHLPSVMSVADRVVVLADGTVVANDRPDVVRHDETVLRVYLGEEPNDGQTPTVSGADDSIGD